MKIISAVDYTFRKVIQVVMNPDDPQWVHEDGPSPVGHTGDTSQSDTPCHDCRMNWKVVEVKWDGDEMYSVAEDGTKTLKTDDELAAEVLVRLAPAPTSQTMTALRDRVL